MMESPLVKFPNVAVPLSKIDRIHRDDDGNAYLRGAYSSEEKTALGCDYEKACKLYNDALLAVEQITANRSLNDMKPYLDLLKNVLFRR